MTIHYDQLYDKELKKIRYAIQKEELATTQLWIKIQLIDKQITEQSNLEKEAFIEDYFPLWEETETTPQSSPFYELKQKGPEIDEKLLNFIDLASEKQPKKKKRIKTHTHLGMLCNREDCNDREEFIAFIPGSV